MRLRSLPGLLLVAALLLFIVPTAVGFYTDWLWFRELGYEGVFLRSLNAQASGLRPHVRRRVLVSVRQPPLRAAADVRAAARRARARAPTAGQIALEGPQLAGLAMPVSIIVALLTGIAGGVELARCGCSYFHAAPFGQTDPLFGRDIGFYVFRLPVYQAVRQQAMLVVGHRALRLPALLRALGQLRGRSAAGPVVMAAHPARHRRAAASVAARGARVRR